jgi:hypothetical protein
VVGDDVVYVVARLVVAYGLLHGSLFVVDYFKTRSAGGFATSERVQRWGKANLALLFRR